MPKHVLAPTGKITIHDVFCANVLDHRCYTANNFVVMYSRKRISQNSVPNFIYIYKVIYDILSGTTRPQKELWKPDLNLGYQGCHHEKTSHPGIEFRTPAYEAGILSLDHQSRY
jgi:hypothetical protein